MIIVNKQDFISNYLYYKTALKQADILKKNYLLPLHASPHLSKIVGHLMGDGNLSKDKYVGDFRFYGNKNKLTSIRDSIKLVFKIKPKQFYDRETDFVLKYNNCKISRILELVGVPRGNKVMTLYGIPEWIKKGNLDIKKSFIRALCDDEMSTPRLNKKGCITSLRLKFNKEESILNSGINFLEEIRQLFIEFGINCSDVKLNNDKYLNIYGCTTRSLYINISSKKENIIRFYNNLNFGERLKRKRLLYVLKTKKLINQKETS